MVKKNKLLIGCLALLLVLSVGYALFSETITINGTATAKGSFDMTATCESGISSKLGTAESLGLASEGGYDSHECIVSGNSVSASVNFNTIGSPKYFTVKVTNSGSIDAVLDMSKVTKEITMCNDTYLSSNPEFGSCQTQTGGYSIAGGQMGDFDALIVTVFKAISDTNDNLLSSSQIGTYYDSQNGILTLPPKYSGYILLYFKIDTLPNQTPNEVNAKITTSLELPFVQAQ